MDEQKIDEARIADFDCEYCHDTGIINGWAELDGEQVVVLKICNCQKPKEEVTGVVYDF